MVSRAAVSAPGFNSGAALGSQNLTRNYAFVNKL